MAQPSHLRSLQALELAVRTGSLKEAGETLGITPAAVGQRIKALEEYLGIELLERGRSGIGARGELTSALPHLHRAFAELETVAAELDLQRGHELHVAATSDFARLWLAPRLPAFRARHPNIRFCINGEGDVPMRIGRVDCEIGFGPVAEDGATDLLFRDFVLPIASPENCARIAGLPPEARLEGFPLLQLDFYKDDPAGLSWREWIEAAGVRRTAPERGMRFQRITAAVDAAQGNVGVSLCGLALILDRIAEGSIQLPYPGTTGIWTRHGFCARFRQDSAGRPHVGGFRAWLQAESRRTADALADRSWERAIER